MDKQHINNLKRRIGDMKSLIESQKQLISRSLECLEQTKASLAVTKILSRENGESISVETQRLHEALIVEACDTASKQMLSLRKMEAEFSEIENALLFHGGVGADS